MNQGTQGFHNSVGRKAEKHDAAEARRAREQAAADAKAAEKKQRQKRKKTNMNKNSILEEYRNVVSVDSLKARRLIKKLDYRQDPYLLQCIAQTYLDECRFEDGTSDLRKNIDKRKWRMAERYIIKAFVINADCAEVLYTMGEIRKVIGQDDIAIYCFEKIIRTKPKEVASGEYGRGILFAKELINDAYFELYRLHYDKDLKLAQRFLSKYKKGLEKGISTIYKPLKKFLLTH